MVKLGEDPRLYLLIRSGLIITSPSSTEYNCIAWAADDTTNWWWPGPEDITYWPPNIPRIETLDAFIKAFAALGYKPCDNDQLEQEYEKVAIYAQDDGTPTHAAKQLPNGKWTSKLGNYVDVEHELHNQLLNQFYGKVAAILKRSRIS